MSDEKQTFNELAGKITVALGELGDDLIDAKSFVLEYDEELSGYAVYAIFVVKGGTVEDNLDALTEKCQAINMALENVVDFVHCVYRSSTEYEQDFGNDYWTERLTNVHAA